MASVRSKSLLLISTQLGIAGLATLLGACDYYLERPADDVDAPSVVVGDSSVPDSSPAADAAVPDVYVPPVDAGGDSAPSIKTFGVGGTVSGLLTGTGLLLQNNGSDDLPILIDGTFVFPTKVPAGTAFAISVKLQPAGQTCGVSGGTGTTSASGGNVASVSVNCDPTRFTIGGTTTNLLGEGLVLQNNGDDDLSVTSNTFAFGATATRHAPYAVTVKTQPSNPSQTCAVTKGTGFTPAANVTDVSVACTTRSFAVGGKVSGLSGKGLVLQNNGGDDLAVDADGNILFTTHVLSGQPFAVTVKTQPTTPTQTCLVAGGKGTVGGADVSSVLVECAVDKFAIGGTALGVRGTGAVLENNGGDDLPVTADGKFAFHTSLDSGQPYLVKVKTHPTKPSQTCELVNEAGFVGAGPVDNVDLTCKTNTYAVGGTVSGLAGTGLVLQNGGADDRAVLGNGAFFFPTPVESGAGYSVTVKDQPTNPSQTCTVAEPGGTVDASDVNAIAITCTTNHYSVSGVVTGLTGTVVFGLNGAEPISMSADGPFAFTTHIASGSPYKVAVTSHPAGKYCSVKDGTGTMGGADVDNVTISCAEMPYATALVAPYWMPQAATRRLVFLYAPAGTAVTSNAEYAAYCTSLGFTQNQNSSSYFQSANMYSATDYYCSQACCYLGNGNSVATYLTAFQNFGLPIGTDLSVFDRGCADYGGTFERGLVTVDALTVTSDTTFSYTPSMYGPANYGQAKSTVFDREGVIVCQEN